MPRIAREATEYACRHVARIGIAPDSGDDPPGLSVVVGLHHLVSDTGEHDPIEDPGLLDSRTEQSQCTE